MKKPPKEKFDHLKLEAEKRKLIVSKENPERLKDIIKQLDFLYWGIK